MKPRALHSHSGLAVPSYLVEDEEGRTHLLIHLLKTFRRFVQALASVNSTCWVPERFRSTWRGAGAAPTRRATRILAGRFVARQSKTTAGILLPRAAHPARIRSSACYTNLRLALFFELTFGSPDEARPLVLWRGAL
jgi:hypothetical protein